LPGTVSTSVVVFTRDLRVRDNPALAEACATPGAVVPLFVVDPSLPIAASPNRLGFLVDSLGDLDASLRARGGRLVVRRGRWQQEVLAVARAVSAGTVHLADDVSAFAQRRLERLVRAAARERIEVRAHPGVTVVPPGAVAPAGGGGYKVFTPYYRRWLDVPWRSLAPTPRRVAVPEGPGLPGVELLDRIALGARSPRTARGGEAEGLTLLRRWAAAGLRAYPDRHDDLAADATSRISPFLHFGCLSPNAVATRLRDRPGAEPFVRQLCWRDFFHQVLASRPDAAWRDYRPRGDRWNQEGATFDAWCAGRTGYPLVDAAMRQLADEGFMHNRARMVVASFLTKDLYLDWRLGAAHFMALLVDGDVANNQLNWQWAAGTGTDTNPARVFNPVVQGTRFDPDATYIRRHVPELAGLDARRAHWPDTESRQRLGYPAPIVDHQAAVAAYRASRVRR
jgi:deoxyribodipyrimidine photo-lyase